MSREDSKGEKFFIFIKTFDPTILHIDVIPYIVYGDGDYTTIQSTKASLKMGTLR
jgi:hypothetical protein